MSGKRDMCQAREICMRQKRSTSLWSGKRDLLAYAFGKCLWGGEIVCTSIFYIYVYTFIFSVHFKKIGGRETEVEDNNASSDDGNLKVHGPVILFPANQDTHQKYRHLPTHKIFPQVRSNRLVLIAGLTMRWLRLVGSLKW